MKLHIGPLPVKMISSLMIQERTNRDAFTQIQQQKLAAARFCFMPQI
jgi:hypothetical protein